MKLKDKIFNNPKLKSAFSEIKETLFSLIKAMLIMFAVNAAVSCLGLAVAGLGWWSFLIALGIAFVDLLPVLGSGAVLVPWSVYCFCTEDFKRGAVLLVLFFVLLLVKFLLEPVVCGKKIGLTTLETLGFSVAGFLLLGASGIITGPIIAVSVRILINNMNSPDIR